MENLAAAASILTGIITSLFSKQNCLEDYFIKYFIQNQGWQSESGIRLFFINYHESEPEISVPDSDSNFFLK